MNHPPKIAVSPAPIWPELTWVRYSQMHARHLSFLREGLLLTESTCTIIIRDILETCKRFAGLVDRWGGDVLPELLMDDAGGGEDEGGNLVHERAEIVKEITQVSHPYRLACSCVSAPPRAVLGFLQNTSRFPESHYALQPRRLCRGHILLTDVSCAVSSTDKFHFGIHC